MQRRLVAAGMPGHAMIGLASTLFGIVVGLCAGGFSLLLRWPGLSHSSSLLREAGLAHVPLLIFFCAIPASLGGLSVSVVPSQIGSARSSVPWMFTAGFACSVSALVMLGGGAIRSEPLLIGMGINLLAFAVMLTAVNLIATILNRRDVDYALLPNVVWTTLIASALSACAAPMAAAACTVALYRGEGLERTVTAASWSALSVVSVLMVGIVSDIFVGISSDRSARSRWIVWMLAIEMPAFFTLWAHGLLHHSTFVLNAKVLHILLVLLLAPFEVLWAGMLLRQPDRSALRSLPVLFAIGFAIVLPTGLLLEAVGMSGHETISLSVIFGLFAGFHRLVPVRDHHATVTTLARLQFWFLLGGAIMLLLPLPPPVGAFGAAMLSLSVGLFAAYLVLARPRDATGQYDTGTGLLPTAGRTVP